MRINCTCDSKDEKVKWFLLGLVIEKLEPEYFQCVEFVDTNIKYCSFHKNTFSYSDASDKKAEIIKLEFKSETKTSDIVSKLREGYTIFVNLNYTLKFDENFTSFQDLYIGYRKHRSYEHLNCISIQTKTYYF